MRRTMLLRLAVLASLSTLAAGCAAPGETSEPATSGNTSPAGDSSDAGGTGPEAVDPAAFARGDGGSPDYVFSSPSGNLSCGISPDGRYGHHAGCHAWSVVDNLPECDDPDAHGPWVAIHEEDGLVHAGCQREGVYAAEDAETLDYGQTLSAYGVTCASTEDGVTCTRGDASFIASRATFGALADTSG